MLHWRFDQHYPRPETTPGHAANEFIPGRRLHYPPFHQNIAFQRSWSTGGIRTLWNISKGSKIWSEDRKWCSPLKTISIVPKGNRLRLVTAPCMRYSSRYGRLWRNGSWRNNQLIDIIQSSWEIRGKWNRENRPHPVEPNSKWQEWRQFRCSYGWRWKWGGSSCQHYPI